MNKYILCVIFTILMHLIVKGQDSPNIEYLLSKKMLEESKIGSVTFLNEMLLTNGHFIVLANEKRFYFLGYGGAYSKDVQNSQIKSFCMIGNQLFFTNGNEIYDVDLLNKKESRVFKLPFYTDKIWSGKNLLYTVNKDKDKHSMYAIDKRKKICIELFSTNSEIKDIVEYGSLIYVLTDSGLTMLSLQDEKYLDIPLSTKKPEKMYSLAIDELNDAMYVSSESGIFRIYDNTFQKVCNDTGILCYDVNGLFVFNNSVPYIFKLNQDVLYPQQTEVIIDIK